MRYLGEDAGGAERISCGVGVEGAVGWAGSWHGTGTNVSLRFCHQLLAWGQLQAWPCWAAPASAC